MCLFAWEFCCHSTEADSGIERERKVAPCEVREILISKRVRARGVWVICCTVSLFETPFTHFFPGNKENDNFDLTITMPTEPRFTIIAD